jgi:hypothetical protein
MSQMRHKSAKLALEVYAQKMNRKRESGARVDELIKGADWADRGRNSEEVLPLFTDQETQEAAGAAS